MPIASVNPATGETIETFEPYDAHGVEARMDEAAKAASVLRHHTTFDQRAQWMHASAGILEADLDAAAQTLTLEMGKPIVRHAKRSASAFTPCTSMPTTPSSS